MAPIPENTSDWVQKTIKNSAIILFSKSYCPYCFGVKQLFKERKIKYATIELDQRVDGRKIQEALQKYSKISTVPQVYVRGAFIGDGSTINKLDEDGKLMDAINKNPYDYDLVVIGGGSGGLAASKEAVKYGAKTAVLDFVKPTPIGTTWGLGGTCVNVGCIPKKLMHQAAIHHQNLEDSTSFGWDVQVKSVKHDWGKMVGAIQDHIHSLNWGYRVVLRDNSVDYLNAYGELIDPHTIKITKKNGETSTITTNKIILAMGERPRYPGIPGDKEYGITSDDLFSLPCPPGRTLCIGASYVSLECAGFLTHLGYDATVMVRSILLRGFDQQMADIVGVYMEKHGTKFIRGCVPTEIRELEPADRENGKPGRFEVIGKYTDGTEYKDEFNTVVFAIGRDPCVDKEVMAKLGVKLDKAGRVVCTDADMSTVENVFAIGDINAGKPQLTPVAIQAGRFLARRLFAGATELTDYVNVPTTVFTPLEYGACGLSEEAAIAKYGKENLEVYHSNFNPLEWSLPHRDDNICYMKLICNNKDLNEKLRQLHTFIEGEDSDTQCRPSSSSPENLHSSGRPRAHSRHRADHRRASKPPSDLSALKERVVGLHVVGPNAGEITQGFAVAIKIGATKEDFDRTIGIHPTCAETFTTLHVTKNSGETAKVTGC